MYFALPAKLQITYTQENTCILSVFKTKKKKKNFLTVMDKFIFQNQIHFFNAIDCIGFLPSTSTYFNISLIIYYHFLFSNFVVSLRTTFSPVNKQFYITITQIYQTNNNINISATQDNNLILVCHAEREGEVCERSGAFMHPYTTVA